MSAIYVVDVILLFILSLLIVFMCGYSVFCVYRLLRSMQMRILLRPTRVVFSHKNEGDSTEELRTVVAYQNPFTGDYCVRKSRLGGVYENAASPDSGVSDEYEPVRLDAAVAQPRVVDDNSVFCYEMELPKPHLKSKINDNSLNKTWNWNYKEYQI